MQFPHQAEVVDTINFKESELAGINVKVAELDADIIIQILKGQKDLPSYPTQRAAKALIETVGEPAMEDIKIEFLQDPFIEGGKSVYIRCKGMNTDVVKSIMFPSFYSHLEASMLES